MSKYKFYISRKSGSNEIYSIETDKPVSYIDKIGLENFVNPKEVEALVDFSTFSGWLNHLVGEVLTIIDASISDSKQNKAVKDIIKKSIYSYSQTHIREMFEGSEEAIKWFNSRFEKFK